MNTAGTIDARNGPVRFVVMPYVAAPYLGKRRRHQTTPAEIIAMEYRGLAEVAAGDDGAQSNLRARCRDRYFVFVGVTRPFLHASVNSALESLPSLLPSTELKFFTVDRAWAWLTLPVLLPSSEVQVALQEAISLWLMVCDHAGPAKTSIATVAPISVLMDCSLDAAC